MYEPTTGRFLEEDPIGIEGGDSNFYRYCGNSPTNDTDPTGLADLGPNTSPPAPGPNETILFFGHHVPSTTTDRNRSQVESVAGWDEIEAALKRMQAALSTDRKITSGFRFEKGYNELSFRRFQAGQVARCR